MRDIETAYDRLARWLDGPDATAARYAIAAIGTSPEALSASLITITEDPESAAGIVPLVERARSCSQSARDSVDIERWLLVRQAIDLLRSGRIGMLGEAARRLTCDELVALLEDDRAARAWLSVAGIRFRESAKMVTGRRFSAGLFHWEICGIRRSWIARVPLRDLAGFGRALLKLGGFGPVMFPHLNPRRQCAKLDEPSISASLAVMAETMERNAGLRGFAAASWLRSPDTPRVSPHLAAINAPILASGGFVTTVGPAAPECGVFDRSTRRRQLYDAGIFKPTVGLVMWARTDMLRWWHSRDCHRLEMVFNA